MAYPPEASDVAGYRVGRVASGDVHVEVIPGDDVLPLGPTGVRYLATVVPRGNALVFHGLPEATAILYNASVNECGVGAGMDLRHQRDEVRLLKNGAQCDELFGGVIHRAAVLLVVELGDERKYGVLLKGQPRATCIGAAAGRDVGGGETLDDLLRETAVRELTNSAGVIVHPSRLAAFAVVWRKTSLFGLEKVEDCTHFYAVTLTRMYLNSMHAHSALRRLFDGKRLPSDSAPFLLGYDADERLAAVPLLPTPRHPVALERLFVAARAAAELSLPEASHEHLALYHAAVAHCSVRRALECDDPEALHQAGFPECVVAVESL